MTGRIRRRYEWRRALLAAAALPLTVALLSGVALAADYRQSPELDQAVKDGKLPPVADRLPADPLVVTPVDKVGTYGGTIRVMHSSTGEFGDANSAVGLEALFALKAEDGRTVVPNLADSWKWSNGDKTLTVHLRKGLKWSDGAPFTTDDIVFWYQDILQNKDIVPTIPSVWMPGGKLMGLKKIDDQTFEMDFSVPDRFIEIMMARNASQWSDNTGMFAPAHFLKPYLPKYTDPGKLDAEAKAAGFSNWVELFSKKAMADDVFGVQNFEAPVMRAFVPARESGGVTTLERNPYYFKVDTAGNQLPYIDHVALSLVQNAEVYTLKASSGEADLAVENTVISQMPVFLQNADQAHYKVLKYTSAQSEMADLMPNETDKDPAKRALFQNFKFREALSIAINRKEINDLVFFGLGEPMQSAILPKGGRCWDDKTVHLYTQYDVAGANKLLDEIGLKYDGKYRTFPDGKPLKITLTYWPGEGGEAKRRIVQLVQGYWQAVGIDLDVREVERSLYFEFTTSNQHDIALWHADSASDPLWATGPKIIPVRNRYGAFGTLWATWFETNGKQGEDPPQAMKDAVQAWKDGVAAGTDEALTKACRAVVKAHDENLWTIGTIGMFPQPIIVSDKLHNVPETGMSSWDWGYLARYHPEQFYLTP